VLDDEINLCEVFAANHHSIEDTHEDVDAIHDDIDHHNVTVEALPPPVQSIGVPVEASRMEVQSDPKLPEPEISAKEEAKQTGDIGEKGEGAGDAVEESAISPAESKSGGEEKKRVMVEDISPTPPESETNEKDNRNEIRVPLCKCPGEFLLLLEYPRVYNRCFH
jgi:hypothetical protein